MDNDKAQKLLEAYYDYLDLDPTEKEMANMMRWFLDWDDIEITDEQEKGKRTLIIKMNGIEEPMARKMSIIKKYLDSNFNQKE